MLAKMVEYFNVIFICHVHIAFYGCPQRRQIQSSLKPEQFEILVPQTATLLSLSTLVLTLATTSKQSIYRRDSKRETRTAETHSNGGVECISIVSIAYTTSIPTLYLFLDHVKYLPTRTFSLMAHSPTYSLL